MGLGLDRLLMLRKGIPDIRLLRASDPRVAQQMLDLEPYRAVSTMPAIIRDLSVAIDFGDDVEQLGDRVRDALGDDALAVEEVSVVTETSYDELPLSAIQRMGMAPGQRNVLLRVLIRDPQRTLTDVEANALRDRVYAAVHQGATQEWALR
jgi:phenylalanyl-tRNA synthetase alpha chain